MGDAMPILSEEEFKKKIKKQLKVAFTTTQVDKNDPFLDTLIDKAFDKFYSAIGDDNWEKKKNEATAIEFANSIARNILGAYGQNYETTHSGIKWDKKIDKLEIETMIQLGIKEFHNMDVTKFKRDKSRDIETEAILTSLSYFNIQKLYDAISKSQHKDKKSQAPERPTQIYMLQAVISALTIQDKVNPEIKYSILRHVLRTLKKSLPSSSALLEVVNNRIAVSLGKHNIDPKNKEQQRADAAAFYSALQTGGPLAHLLTDENCSKLVATMMKQAEKLAPNATLVAQAQSPEASLTGRLQRLQPAPSPGPSLTESSPHLTLQRDSKKKQEKATPTEKTEPPIAEDKSKPKKPKPTS